MVVFVVMPIIYSGLSGIIVKENTIKNNGDTKKYF